MDELVSDAKKIEAVCVLMMRWQTVSHQYTDCFDFLLAAMLAVVGYLTTYAGVRLAGMESMPAGFAAIKSSAWMDNPVAKVRKRCAA